MKASSFLILNIKAGEYFERFLIAAVATVLGVRFFLDISGYPKIGGGGLHIAHMLWGGLLMLVALLFLLNYLNKALFSLSAVLGGVGFGLFIDELGKFITNDNDYFFQPTFALIYIVFIIIFLVFRTLEKRHKFSEKDITANVFDLVRQLATEKYDPRLSSHALELLQSGKVYPMVTESLQNILNEINSTHEKEKLSQNNLLDKLTISYENLVRSKWVIRGILALFALLALYNLWKAIDVVSLYLRFQEFSLSFTEISKFVSSIISSFLVALGVIVIRFSSRKGYKVLQIGFLFSLFVTQFFDFYDNQLAAAGIFLVTIFCLFALHEINRLSQQEESVSGGNLDYVSIKAKGG